MISTGKTNRFTITTLKERKIYKARESNFNSVSNRKKITSRNFSSSVGKTSLQGVDINRVPIVNMLP